jgi:hypothetical protein
VEGDFILRIQLKGALIKGLPCTPLWNDLAVKLMGISNIILKAEELI